MFRTLTTSQTTTTRAATTLARRRRPLIAAALGLAIVASACGEPTTQSAVGESGFDAIAGADPLGAVPPAGNADIDFSTATTSSDRAPSTDDSSADVSAAPSPNAEEPATDSASTDPAPTDLPPSNTPPSNGDPIDQPGDEPAGDGPAMPGENNDNPGPFPPSDFGTVRISSPELHVAQACFADVQALTWTAQGTNEMVLDDRLGQLSAVRDTRSPLTITRNDNGGPLFAESFNTMIDQNRGFSLDYEINGSIGDIDLHWESNTTASGGHTSDVFVSDANPLCFVRAGFRVTIDDAPPTGPQRPSVEDAIDPAGEFAPVGEPVADFEVGVRNVKIDAAANCFAGALLTRVFDTGAVPVTVVLDTNGISDTLAITDHHQGTELTDELRQLAISGSALRAPADRAEGYAVTVQLQGHLTGGITIEWVTTVTQPGRATSPVFSSPTGDCDVSINFTVVEID